MAFDGITIAAIVAELNDQLAGARITKIAQPERDELMLTLKTTPRPEQPGGTKRLFISADAALPLIYLSDANKIGPKTAPGFCMLLRKHIGNGRISAVTQPGLERIVVIHINHLNEMGDYQEKKLIIEIMGKHSNIIFVNHEDVIMDGIKHVPGMMSSLREVLPGRPYFIPETLSKLNPLDTIFAEFYALISEKSLPLFQALYLTYAGLSPQMAQEICHRAGMEGDMGVAAVPGEAGFSRLYEAFSAIIDHLKAGRFEAAIYYQDNKPRDFSLVPMTIYADMERVAYTSVSAMLSDFYKQRNQSARMRQKSADLRKIIQNILERDRKKYDMQLKQIEDTQKKEQFRLYGELLNTYGHSSPEQASKISVPDHYSGEMLTIPLDPKLSAHENAQKYFDKYNKMKRTAQALNGLTEEVKEEIAHLETIQAAIDIAAHEEDLVDIKEEMIASGYIRRRGGGKAALSKSRPYHYISNDGFHIYVGKNNYQNEHITFKLADGGDYWFHAKQIAGSHVIVKTLGREMSDKTYEEAAALAAHYSVGRAQEKVEVDYTERKNVKKPNGKKPGFVIYHTNYSLVAKPDISALEQAP